MFHLYFLFHFVVGLIFVWFIHFVREIISNKSLQLHDIHINSHTYTRSPCDLIWLKPMMPYRLVKDKNLFFSLVICSTRYFIWFHLFESNISLARSLAHLYLFIYFALALFLLLFWSDYSVYCGACCADCALSLCLFWFDWAWTLLHFCCCWWVERQKIDGNARSCDWFCIWHKTKKLWSLTNYLY